MNGRPLTDEDLEGASYLVWGGDDTNSLIFGTCKCEDCHNEHGTFAMEVGDRAARWGIWTGLQRQYTLEDRGRFAANGIRYAYEERRHDDERASR